MDSPFAEYLDSGYNPSDAEIPLIKALIQQKIDAIGSIDKEIKEIIDSLAALKARRKANKIFVQKHQALIAPIKRLPPDILSTVFLASLPVTECTEASMTCNHPAVVISQDPVNSPLHRVNGETAALFDSVVQRLFDLTTIWLSRSKGCPLTIFIKASESAAGGFDTSQSGILEGSLLMGLGKLVGLLLSESKRWEQVRFNLEIIGYSRKSQLSRLLFLAPRDVPILRKASIVINSVDIHILEVPINPSVASEQTNFWDGIVMSTIHGQALQSLTLACPKNATKLKGLQVNWGGLIELSLRPFTLGSGRKGVTHLTTDEALTLLRLCPNLKRCNLAIGNGSHASDWGAPPPVWNPSTTPLAFAPIQDDRPVCRLPHLHSLILREDSGRAYGLASALDLPSLRSFTQINPIQWSRPGMPAFYLDSEHERPWNVIPLVEWVQRFGHTITSIDIKHTGVPQHDVEKCLEGLPNLISLAIRSPFLESLNTTSPWGLGSLACDSFLKTLTPEVTEDGDTVTVTPGCLCPKLEDLALNSFPSSVPASMQLMFHEASVLEFLTGRAKASSKTVPEVNRVSKLRYVRVALVDQKVVDIEQELLQRGCNIEGFVGEWNYPDPPSPHSYLETPHIIDFAKDEF
ncbi:hypothetical protein H1R20_g16543, partial [Candolleomyces eurysporus]